MLTTKWVKLTRLAKICLMAGAVIDMEPRHQSKDVARLMANELTSHNLGKSRLPHCNEQCLKSCRDWSV